MGSLYKRGKTWWIKYYDNGRPFRESSGSTREKDAKELLKQREGKIADGVPVTPKLGRVTFEDAAKDLENEYSINGRKTLADLKRRIKLHLEPAFRGKRLAHIQTADVRRFIADRLEATAKPKPAEINRELSALKRMFTLAIKDGKLLHRPHIPMLAEDNVRRGFFEREQFEALRGHLPKELQPIATFAYLTGWRLRSEILPLQWRNVDWEAKEVRLDPGTTKNRAGRAFPFTVELKALLDAQHAEHEQLKAAGQIVPYVFHRGGKRARNIRGAWLAACRDAGVPGRLIHDLRRTAVRNLELAGVPRSDAMKMVGHKTQSVYLRYAISDTTSLRAAAERINLAAGTNAGTNGRSGTKSRGKRSA